MGEREKGERGNGEKENREREKGSSQLNIKTVAIQDPYFLCMI